MLTLQDMSVPDKVSLFPQNGATKNVTFFVCLEETTGLKLELRLQEFRGPI